MTIDKIACTHTSGKWRARSPRLAAAPQHQSIVVFSVHMRTISEQVAKFSAAIARAVGLHGSSQTSASETATTTATPQLALLLADKTVRDTDSSLPCGETRIKNFKDAGQAITFCAFLVAILVLRGNARPDEVVLRVPGSTGCGSRLLLVLRSCCKHRLSISRSGLFAGVDGTHLYRLLDGCIQRRRSWRCKCQTQVFRCLAVDEQQEQH